MPKRYWWVIITYVLVQFSGVIFIPLLYAMLPINQIDAFVYWSLISFIAGVIIVLQLMKPDMKQGVNQRDAASTGNVILWSILGVFMAYFAQGIAGSIEVKLLGIGQDSENTQAIMDVTRMSPLFMIIPMFAAPILEEIIFRKIIFGRLYLRTNFFIAALLSALIFAVIHGEPEHILVYGSMGLVFAYLYVKTKRIIVPIIVHMAMNSLVVLIQYNIDPEELERQLEELQTIFMLH
ncbi:MAG: CPBP family intramembrane glutamic endopeptidase [Bacillota bacterium]|uniref:CPBP family intramembrane metalloprotease n=1 Tax=Virgibacillus salarius TaxID=447199 RepID=A0A941E042_9BACI|nr:MULTISPECIES: type II CAAX endopeptidase family protein [Virgibacillus]MBR7798239.1 CPBP family intramembrane metalloprotease [Virgibacillus salarius]MDY7044383.1 type II CAAX endopeptidase family protein [Virgibacillus sp. M23]NAZ10947.1 CPBP family intramembrane metalloprotease [Agaribacter marinus]